MKVKLTQGWTNPADAKAHAVGAVLELDDAKGKCLCDAGIAEAEATASDVKTLLDGAMAEFKDGLSKAAAEAIKSAAKGLAIRDGIAAYPIRITGGTELADEDPMGGFRDHNEYYLAVRRSSLRGGTVDERLPKIAQTFRRKMLDRFPQFKSDPDSMAKVAAVGTGEAGGFLVPEDVSAELYKRMVGRLGIMEQCKKLILNGFSVTMPGLLDDDKSTAAGRYAGIIVYNVAEGGAITGSQLKFRKIRLEVHKKAALAGASEEMLSAVSNFGSLLTEGMGDALGDEVVEDVFFGSGSGICLGAFVSPACVSIAKEADQAADSIVTKNIVKMESVFVGEGGQFYYNGEGHSQLSLLTLTVGTSGIPLMISAGGFGNAPVTTIRGRQATITDHCEALGDSGDIVLADWSKYLLAVRGGVKTAMSAHFWFDQDLEAFKATIEVDGKPAWDKAMKPRKGNAATRISPFVKVAERA